MQGVDSLKWQVADMLSLPFQADTFDAVIEKGTMDVLFVDNDSPWDPNPEVRSRVLTMLDETHRSADALSDDMGQVSIIPNPLGR